MAIPRAARVTARIGSRIARLAARAISEATAAEPRSANSIRRVDDSAVCLARSFSSIMFFWLISRTSSARRLMASKSGSICSK